MPPSEHVEVRIDLARIRANTQDVARRVGVPLLAVVKADAYGLGAARVAEAIADLVEGFCVFDLREAIDADLGARIGKTILALGPPNSSNAQDYLAQRVRPAVSTADQAAALCAARPILSIDTGMQRFACPPHQIDRVLRAGECDEAFTHATRREHALRLANITSDRMLRLHAAGSALLDDPLCRFDAVRPGIALYRGAVRVSSRLAEARDTAGPLGYSAVPAHRHGVILAGYAHGLRPGPCLVSGQPRRLLEVGMQSAYVELGPDDKKGDAVILLGDGLSEDQVASQWQTTPHEALFHLCRLGHRLYDQP